MKKRFKNDFIELMDNIINGSPELKRAFEEDEQYKEDRKQYYLSQGFAEEEAKQKSWNDYWKRAKDRDGVDFSITKIN